MNKNALVAKATRMFYKTKAQAIKHGPAILIGAGIAGVVASTVMACKATLKVNDVIAQAKVDLDNIHETAANEELNEKYTEEDAKKDITNVYLKTGVSVAKAYAPAVAVGAISIGCILKSHDILHKRNISLAAAYTTLYNSFKDYRKQTKERFGEAVDRELKYHIHNEKVDQVTVDENGKEKKNKVITPVSDMQGTEGYSEYARFFDETSRYWKKNSEYNLTFLLQTQAHANEILKSRGHLFLNEVYRMLDIPETLAGQSVGWVYNYDGNANGDNYVDFGIYEVHRKTNREFVNGYERTIILDFNVDGDVLSCLA